MLLAVSACGPPRSVAGTWRLDSDASGLPRSLSQTHGLDLDKFKLALKSIGEWAPVIARIPGSLSHSPTVLRSQLIQSRKS